MFAGVGLFVELLWGGWRVGLAFDVGPFILGSEEVEVDWIFLIV